jgi:hypothetical protein
MITNKRTYIHPETEDSLLESQNVLASSPEGSLVDLDANELIVEF